MIIHHWLKSLLLVEIKIMSENILHLGLCLPKSCSNNQVHDLVQLFLDQQRLELGLGLQTKVLEVKSLKFNPKLFFKTSVLILVAFTAVLTWLNRSASKLEKSVKIDENNNIAQGTEREIKFSLCNKIIQCFHYDKNKNVIRSRDSPKLSVSSISGMR